MAGGAAAPVPVPAVPGAADRWSRLAALKRRIGLPRALTGMSSSGDASREQDAVPQHHATFSPAAADVYPPPGIDTPPKSNVSRGRVTPASAAWPPTFPAAAPAPPRWSGPPAQPVSPGSQTPAPSGIGLASRFRPASGWHRTGTQRPAGPPDMQQAKTSQQLRPPTGTDQSRLLPSIQSGPAVDEALAARQMRQVPTRGPTQAAQRLTSKAGVVYSGPSPCSRLNPPNLPKPPSWPNAPGRPLPSRNDSVPVIADPRLSAPERMGRASPVRSGNDPGVGPWPPLAPFPCLDDADADAGETGWAALREHERLRRIDLEQRGYSWNA